MSYTFQRSSRREDFHKLFFHLRTVNESLYEQPEAKHTLFCILRFGLFSTGFSENLFTYLNALA